MYENPSYEIFGDPLCPIINEYASSSLVSFIGGTTAQNVPDLSNCSFSSSANIIKIY